MVRINRAIQLLEQGQPIYYGGVDERSFESGVASAGTWVDYIAYDMEHHAFDVGKLHDFMRGLAAGGPTRSGHRTPAVIVTLPIDGASEANVRANSWIIKQVLATGVHGMLLCHAETEGAVRAFVECARFPYFRAGVGNGLDDGRRGAGGQAMAAEIWGVDVDEYLHRCDVWPLNPAGELMLGIKVENKRALANVEQTTRVPGIAFAEWGPGDMGMSLGFPNNHDEPYPQPMQDARSRVMAACQAAGAAGIAFLNAVNEENVVRCLDEGVMVCACGRTPQAAEIGRRHTKRTLPW